MSAALRPQRESGEVVPTSCSRRAFSVARINPFWRWAVCLSERPDIPAVPFFRRAEAETFADESRAAFPERTTLMLKRRLWRRVDVV